MYRQARRLFGARSMLPDLGLLISRTDAISDPPTFTPSRPNVQDALYGACGPPSNATNGERQAWEDWSSAIDRGEPPNKIAELKATLQKRIDERIDEHKHRRPGADAPAQAPAADEPSSVPYDQDVAYVPYVHPKMVYPSDDGYSTVVRTTSYEHLHEEMMKALDEVQEVPALINVSSATLFVRVAIENGGKVVISGAGCSKPANLRKTAERNTLQWRHEIATKVDERFSSSNPTDSVEIRYRIASCH